MNAQVVWNCRYYNIHKHYEKDIWLMTITLTFPLPLPTPLGMLCEGASATCCGCNDKEPVEVTVTCYYHNPRQFSRTMKHIVSTCTRKDSSVQTKNEKICAVNNSQFTFFCVFSVAPRKVWHELLYMARIELWNISFKNVNI